MFLDRPGRKVLIGLVALVIFIGFVIFFNSMHHVGSTKQLLPTIIVNHSYFEYEKEDKESVLFSQKVIVEPTTEYVTLMGNPIQVAEIEEWFANRGNYNLSDKNVAYRGYDKLTLEKLAAEGDLRAIHALADFYLDPKNIEYGGFDPAIEQYWNAAIYGSTDAFRNLAHIHKIKVYEASNSVDEKSRAVIEMLALYKTASLRGDRWGELNDVPTFLKMENIHLLPDDQNKIDARAREIYSDIELKRNAKGLGDFDDSTPDSVKNLFEKIERMEEKSP